MGRLLYSGIRDLKNFTNFCNPITGHVAISLCHFCVQAITATVEATDLSGGARKQPKIVTRLRQLKKLKQPWISAPAGTSTTLTFPKSIAR